MEQPWRLAAAAAMIAAMAGGIVWFGLSDGDDGRTVPTSRAAAAAPATTVPPAEESPDPVLAATKGALAAWGELAVTGDLAVLDGWYVADGPQMSQIRAEAPELRAAPLGPPPYAFELRDPAIAMRSSDEAVVTSLVTMTRPGEPAQTFRWRIHLRRADGAWQLWTVEAVE